MSLSRLRGAVDRVSTQGLQSALEGTVTLDLRRFG
jgi:hypothetical protein